MQYIASHTHENITLEQLAKDSEYSKEYIAKLFRKHMGLSISDYIRKTKIDEAKELLRKFDEITGNSLNTAREGEVEKNCFVREFLAARLPVR